MYVKQNPVSTLLVESLTFNAGGSKKAYSLKQTWKS